jgi:hypothetical protein
MLVVPAPLRVALCALASALAGAAGATADDAAEAARVASPEPPGLGDPGALASIAIEGSGDPARSVLRGPDARRQLVVTGHYASGQLRDLTARSAFEASPPGVVLVDAAGFVTPAGDGKATVVARSPEGLTAEIALAVEGFSQPRTVNFPNQIVPIFTKHGCNGGGCHGKSGGQNGFRLSLLGFQPEDDHEYLVKEGRGRRISAAPEHSLLLQKATNAVAHGGGARFEPGSYEYGLVRRWIIQGMPYGDPKDPRVESLEVVPAARAMDRRSAQQVSVFARYTDGSIEDVTRMAQYEANDRELAEATPAGLVKTLDLTGEVAVMVRFQGQVGVFRASIPLGVEVKDLPPAKNFVDELVFKKLEALGIPPSPLADDGTFIRRVTFDICGRLPAADESRRFLADSDPAKRQKLIDRLLESTDYADHFAQKWSALFRNKRTNPNQARGSFAFHAWIRDSLHRNKPYDRFAREVLAASGDAGRNPPVVWYRAVDSVEEQVEDAAQLFLGLKIQCARCHHHPFERWSQDDYYGLAAFFSRVKRKGGIDGRQDEPRILHDRGTPSARNPRTGRTLKPAGLGGAALDIEPDRDPRGVLAGWMADPKNPFFAPALANRYWKHFFGRGIVEPEDDLRVTNPPSNPELLHALADHFTKSGFDLKDLVRTICRSSAYQLSSEPNDWNARDRQSFSRFLPRRLNAEVFHDAIALATGVPTAFSGLPAGTRAADLPGSNDGNYFLTVFGKPQGDSACECERSGEASLAQSLYLLNSADLQGKVASGSGRAAGLARDASRSDEEKVRDLHLLLYSRDATASELELALAHLKKAANKQEAYEDLVWALVNTKEFEFNH